MNAIFVCNESTLTSIPDGLAYTKSLTSRLFPNRLSFTSDAVIVEFVIRPAISFLTEVDYRENGLGERGVPVDDTFEYNSGTNPWVLSVDEIRQLLG